MERLRVESIFAWLALAFVLHEAEEWNLVAWFEAHFTPAPGFTDRGARTLLVLFSVLAVAFTGLCLRVLSPRGARLALLPFYLGIVAGNALTHVFWLVSFRSYAPGVVTSALLVLPLTALLVTRVLRERLVPAAYVGVWLAIALAQPLGAAWAGDALLPGQIAFQELGESLATRLFGPAS